MTAVEIAFWASAGLIVWTHAGYPLALLALAGLARSRAGAEGTAAPSVSLIVAAHDEEKVIAAKVANALALEYPRDRLELIVASDGSTDGTAELARGAGADLVLELPGRARCRPRMRPRSGRPAKFWPSPTRTRSGRRTRW